VPGYEAPTNIAWSEKNRSPLGARSAARGTATRIELRMPDPSCNPYLALAVMLRAGLDGIEKHVDPGPPINKNIFTMSHRERRHLRIDELPGNLSEALDELEKDDLVRDTLGEHLFEHFLAAKREEMARLHQARVAVGGRSLSRRLLERTRLPHNSTLLLQSPPISTARDLMYRRRAASDHRGT
jgi:glutamine synthetase